VGARRQGSHQPVTNTFSSCDLRLAHTQVEQDVSRIVEHVLGSFLGPSGVVVGQARMSELKGGGGEERGNGAEQI
jgi:hypothetical protein